MRARTDMAAVPDPWGEQDLDLLKRSEVLHHVRFLLFGREGSLRGSNHGANCVLFNNGSKHLLKSYVY